MSTLVQLDLEDRDLRDLQRTLEKETSSFTTGKTYFYRTGKGEMKSGKYVGETGGKVIMETPDGGRKGVPRGQMIDPDLVVEEEVKEAQKYAELKEAEARSRSVSGAPSPRRRSRDLPRGYSEEIRRGHETSLSSMASAERSKLSAVTPTIPMMGGGGEDEAAVMGVGGMEEYAYAGGRRQFASQTATPRETAIREEIAEETEPAALLALHQSAAIAERERSVTPTPIAQPQPEPEPLGLPLELAEEEERAGQWEPVYRESRDFKSRGRLNEDFGLGEDELILVDNRSKTHTEEGRPIIWGHKDELYQKIRDSGLSAANIKRAERKIEETMRDPQRSWWTGNPQILEALGFE